MLRASWVFVVVFAVACGGDGSGGAGGGGGSAGAGAGGGGAGGGGAGGGAPTCGDGATDAGESCDDGNTADDDGCDADCVPSEVIQIAAAPEHTCVLTRTGAVRCWGRGTSGRLGYGNTDSIGDTPGETPASAGSVDVGGAVVQIAVGAAHTCALLEGGTIRCWGRGADGRLGYGDEADVGSAGAPALAGDLDLGAVAVQVAAGFDHTCALLVGGVIRCWGANGSGQLGYGAAVDAMGILDAGAAPDVPVDPAGTPAIAVAAGYGHTCALLQGGAVRCWGENTVGQAGHGLGTFAVGDDETPDSIGPVDVGWPAAQIAAVYASTCARSDQGAIRCWGLSANGETGYGTTSAVGDGESPSAMDDISIGGAVLDVNAGPCALLEGGILRCWGLGVTGALGLASAENIGDDDLPTDYPPIDVGGEVVLQHSDGIHACAKLASGALRCWGRGSFGMLGNGDTADVGLMETPAQTADVVVF